jgi:hypothetical protein
MHFTPLTMPIFSVTSGMPKPLKKSEIQEAAVVSGNSGIKISQNHRLKTSHSL